MVRPMRSKPLLSKSELLKTRKAAARALPMRVSELEGCELIVQCDRCGRLHRLYPGPADLDPRAGLAGLLTRLSCVARTRGRACGGRPRRLELVRDECRWVMDQSGVWIEDDSAFWESGDFAVLAQRGAQPTL